MRQVNPKISLCHENVILALYHTSVFKKENRLAVTGRDAISLMADRVSSPVVSLPQNAPAASMSH
jgi:hypothetical protein